ncbi:MAG: glycogen-binding domain-containing protein [Bacteroidota bacterium]|nr:glycogen-binding domain-containing protein [Bacteroidota bacterium]
MTHKIIRIALVGIFLISLTNVSAQVAAVRFTVQIPHGNNDDKNVYMAGSFNYWHAGDSLFQMNRVSEDVYAITLPLFEGRQYQYKYTLGNWDKVEVASNDSDIQNRFFFSSNGKDIADTVTKWKQPKIAEKKVSLQIEKMTAMKDSMLAQLQPKLNSMKQLLQSYIMNLLQEKPSQKVHRHLDKQAIGNIGDAYKKITKLMWDIFASFSLEQKQKILDAVNQPEAKGDFLKAFLAAMGNSMAEKKPAP